MHDTYKGIMLLDKDVYGYGYYQLEKDNSHLTMELKHVF